MLYSTSQPSRYVNVLSSLKSLNKVWIFNSFLYIKDAIHLESMSSMLVLYINLQRLSLLSAYNTIVIDIASANLKLMLFNCWQEDWSSRVFMERLETKFLAKCADNFHNISITSMFKAPLCQYLLLLVLAH